MEGYYFKLIGGIIMGFLGDAIKIAGGVVGNVICPGIGGIVGGVAGNIVGDAVDGDKKDKGQAQNSSNPLALGMALAGGNTQGSSGIIPGTIDGITDIASGLLG